MYCDFSAHPNRMNERICIVVENVCFSFQDYYSYFIDCWMENHVECNQSTSIIQWISLSIHHFLVTALHPQKFARITTLKFITQLYETDTIQCVNAYELQLNSNRAFIAQTNLPVKCSKACTLQIHGIWERERNVTSMNSGVHVDIRVLDLRTRIYTLISIEKHVPVEIYTFTQLNCKEFFLSIRKKQQQNALDLNA